MRIRALGPLAVEMASNDVRTLRGKPGRVLATLLASAGSAVSSDRLVDAVWGERPPKSARNALQVYVSQIRTLLGEGEGAAQVVTNAKGYLLDLRDAQFDVQQFEVALATARESSVPATKSDHLSRALAMWSGRAYEPWDTDEDLRPEAVRLEELRLVAEEELASSELGLGHHAELVDKLRLLADQEPLRERRWAMLMVALYRNGRQAEALRTYQHVRDLLGTELGIEPGPELTALEERILLQDPGLAVDVASSPTRNNVPQPIGRIVGRQQDLAHLADLLETGSRLITIYGPGGIGKTRLAIELANSAADAGRFDQVTMIALDSIDVAEAIDGAVAAELAGNPDVVASAVEAIGDRHILLVLDNCEHLAAPIAELTVGILGKCRNATVLATSRSTLKVTGEAKLALGPLPATNAASELFRVRAAEAGFMLPEGAEEDVAAICDALDGIPLAIELAAARLSILTLPELRIRLGEASLLEGDASRTQRHRSAVAAVRWSYDLLDAEQQQAFEVLSVFRGGFTADAAESSLSFHTHAPPLTVVSALHDAALLMRGEGRLRMLEPVRQFAEQRLIESGRIADALDSLARWVLRRVDDATSRLGTPANMAAIHALDGERGNIEVALRHLMETDHDRFVAAVADLAEYWWRIGDLGTGDQWITEALTVAEVSPRLLRYAAMFLSRVRPESNAGPLLDRLGAIEPNGANIRSAEAHVAWSRGDMVAARDRFESAAEAQREARDGELIDTVAQLSRMRLAEGDAAGAIELADELDVMGRAGERADAVPLAEHVRGLTLAFGGDYAAAAPHLAVAAKGFEQLGMERQLIGALRGLGMARANLGDIDAAQRNVARSLELARSAGDRSAVMFGQMALGLVATERNEPEVATGLVDRALRQAVLDRDEQAKAWCLFAAARIAHIRGNLEKAGVLLAASDRLVAHWKMGAPSATWRPDRPMTAALVVDLGRESFETARAEGSALSGDAAIELALGYPIGWVMEPAPRR